MERDGDLGLYRGYYIDLLLQDNTLNAALMVPKRKPETRGFCGLPNPGFGFGKMAGFPRAPGFSKPGFQSLVSTTTQQNCMFRYSSTDNKDH